MSSTGDVIQYVEMDGGDGASHQTLRRVQIYKSQQTYKTAAVCTYGSSQKRWLVVQTCERVPGGSGWDFEHPQEHWAASEGQITVLQKFLNEEFPESGAYTLASANSDPTALVQRMTDGELDPDVVSRLVGALSTVEGAAELIAESDERGLLAGLIERHRQRKRLAAVREVVLDSTKNENDIQRLIKNEAWLFGGRYVRVATRRRLTALHEVDIPLIRADGALHIVELKRSNIAKLVQQYRNEWIVGAEVNEAVGQAMNYLRTLDEHRPLLLSEIGIDARRAAATVVIGHPNFVATGATPAEVNDAIRMYNAHLSRVEVMTYQDLLDGAERAFELAAPEGFEA
ncbi:Shedu anti-phage system protein SduA domain-containing protein [Dactylosporangium sp. NPDC000521]|uniref:Shedu anti-phage system protein SduA domain-containing protein n=1 Tax=Dactylosporangium sp. NPDC000521 TaxID=3363975 RepID=UPI003685BF18